jgi:molybdenum cofactor guanylyltransferase
MNETSPLPPDLLGGVILCGGRSSRMGRAKAWLPFAGELLLQRVVRIVGQVASPIVVVAAPDQEVPELPREVRILRDPTEGRGPLQGIAVGLEALAEEVPYAYVSSTDAPFLSAAFIRAMRGLAEGHEAAVVKARGHHHPLSAIYATALHRPASELLAADLRRPFFLFERTRTRFVNEADLLADEALRALDPALEALRNLNTPEDYERALRDLERFEDSRS